MKTYATLTISDLEDGENVKIDASYFPENKEGIASSEAPPSWEYIYKLFEALSKQVAPPKTEETL